LLKLNCAAIARCTFQGTLNDAGICWLCPSTRVIQWSERTGTASFDQNQLWLRLADNLLAAYECNKLRKSFEEISSILGKTFLHFHSDKSSPNGASLNVGLEPRAKTKIALRKMMVPPFTNSTQLRNVCHRLARPKKWKINIEWNAGTDIWSIK